MRKIAVLIVILVVSSLACSKVNSEEEVFKKRLLSYLMAPLSVSVEAKKQSQLLENNLVNFSKEFPNSKYADDAQYVPNVIPPVNDKKIISMYELVKKYPEGKLEDYTIKLIEDFFKKMGQASYTPYFNLFYSQALILMKAEKFSFIEQNWSESMKFAKEFIDNADEGNLKIRQDLRLAYMIYFVSLQKLGKLEDAEQVKRKTLMLFPDAKF